MTRHTRWVIERRTPSGALDLNGAQPETVFGVAAITGITEDTMAKIVFWRIPNATLSGADIPTWPSRIDPAWRARPKTW